jgi:alpha-galactosidase
MTLELSAVGFPPHAHLRDLWRHKDVHAHHGAYTVTVPAHGVVLLRLTR